MHTLSDHLAALAGADPAALTGVRRGIEKESLRVSPAGDLSLAPHPPALGSALTHPHITTDFSEAQLELKPAAFPVASHRVVGESEMGHLRPPQLTGAWSRDEARRGRGDGEPLAAEGLQMVLSFDASRLARNNGDWYQLLELCSVFGTLIADSERVYDPNLYGDRMLLGLSGMMSEAAKLELGML